MNYENNRFYWLFTFVLIVVLWMLGGDGSERQEGTKLNCMPNRSGQRDCGTTIGISFGSFYKSRGYDNAHL
jgi:hypothetical protein